MLSSVEEQRAVCYSEHASELGGDAADSEDVRWELRDVFDI